MPILETNVRPQQRQHVLGKLIYSQSRDARLMRRAAAVVGVVLGLAILRFSLQSLLPQYAFRKDFLQEYVLARAMADRIDPYLPLTTLARRYLGLLPQSVFPHPTPHPPTVGLLILPLSRFDYSTAAAVWFALELACLVAAVRLLGRGIDARLPAWMVLAIAMALLIWYPFPVELISGQLMLPILALLTGAWVALRSDWSVLGGVLLGLAVLIKPVSLVFIVPLVARRDWLAVLGTASVVLCGYLLAGWLIGLDGLADYFTTVLPLVARSYQACARNVSLSTLGWRVFDGTRAEVVVGIVAPPLVRSAAAARVVSVALPGVALLIATLRVWRERSPSVSWAVMSGVAILCSPISWAHYLVFAAIPAAYAVGWLARHRLPARETNTALVVAMLLVIDWSRLAYFMAGAGFDVDETVTVPFALALVTVMPTVAVAALVWLVAWLGSTETSMTAALED